jgi:hypothetical protein
VTAWCGWPRSTALAPLILGIKFIARASAIREARKSEGGKPEWFWG